MSAAIARFHDSDKHRNYVSRCQLTKHDETRQSSTHFNHIGVGGDP
jgi:hypothetical protein